MNQAQGIRYKKRIGTAGTAVFLLVSVIGIYAFQKSAGSELASSLAGLLYVSGFIVLPIAFLISWVTYSIFDFMYLRDPGYSLEEGCYSDVSWLNLNNNQLVLLDDDAIVTADFDAEQADKISADYQNDSSCKKLEYVQSAQQLHRVRFTDIEVLKSQTDKNIIEITGKHESVFLQFKNSGTKAHAYKHIKARLPATLKGYESATSKVLTMKTVLPQLSVCALFAIGALLANQLAVSLIIGAPILLLLPSILESFYKPAIESEFKTAQIEAAAQIDNEPAIQKAA